MDLKPIIFSALNPPLNITVVTPDSGLPELSEPADRMVERGFHE